MAASLFRLEAIEFQRKRAWAGAPTAPPLGTWMLTGFMAAAVAAAAVFLALGTYSRKESVTGYLTPTGGIARVLASAAGVVADVFVTEGETVVAGQRLLLIRSERYGAQGQAVDGAILERLKAKRNAVADRIDIEQRSAEQQKEALMNSIGGLEAELATMTESMQTQRARLKLAYDQVEAVRPTVAQGFTSTTEFRRRQDIELSLQQATTDLSRQISAKAVEVRDKRLSLRALDAKNADNTAVLQAALADADAAVAEAQAKQGYVVSAPVGGVVSSLQAAVGMHTDPAIPFLSIVPTDTPLEVSLFVPARAIGFVAAGQTVRLAFDPFPSQRFGFYNAAITSVSDALLKPSEAGGPITLKEPSYRVVARLERQTITAYGDEIKLRPEISLKADIVFDRRTLFGWLFDPLLSARGRL